MSVDPAEAAARTKDAARAEGFALVGIAAATPIDPVPLDRWLAQGWDAGLWYVRQSRDERLDVSLVQPGARSVVAVAVPYLHPEPTPPSEPHGVVARYARGRDYHNVMRKPLRRLRDRIEEIVPGSTGYASCDARPVMEKQWAQRAGLGWIGKNGTLIAPPYGSWVLLGCVVTTAELTVDAPHPDRCGTCVACLSSCPTDAIPEPRFIDAGKCLSFHTIEHQDAMPEAIAKNVAGRLFGCDLCQDPCPWNRDPQLGTGKLHAGLAPGEGRSFVPLDALLKKSDVELESFSQGTPLARAGAKGLRRTAEAIARAGADDDRGGDDRGEDDR